MFRSLIAAYATVTLLISQSAHSEEMIVALRVNGQNRGDVLIDTQANGDVRIDASDAAKLGFTSDRVHAITNPNGAVVLSSTSNFNVKLNMESLSLDVTVAPDWFARNVLSLSTRSKATIAQLDGIHGWLNYSLAMQGAIAARPSGTLETNAVASLGAWTFRSDQNAAFRASGNQFNRTHTSLAHDNATELTRLSFGDVTALAGLGTSSSRLIGVQWGRHFEFDPTIAAQPTFNWSGQLTSPSTVEVLVDGIRAKTFSLAPGPFDLRDLAYFGGLRNVEVVIRDRSGLETRTQVPYYFSSELLAKGKDTFDVSGGVSESVTGRKTGALLGQYRRGLNDNITLGAGAEAKTSYQSARIEAAARHESLGTLLVTAAASRLRGEPVRTAATLAHSWNGGRVSTQVTGAWQQPGFGIDRDSRAGARELSHRVSASGSVSFDHQRSASVNFSRSAFVTGAPEIIASLRAAQGWGRGSSFWASVSVTQQDTKRANGIAVGFSMPIGQSWSVSSGYSKQAGEAPVETLRASRSGTSDGWTDLRLAAEHRSSTTTLDGFVQRPMALGVATVAARAEQRGRSNDASTEVRFSGAVTWADQQVWLSPPVPQSFAIVDAAGVAGVRVMHNNQLIGRTNADGKLLLPNLAAFATNQVRIDDRDIPMEIELGSVQQEVAPRLNAGAKVKFAGKRVSAVAGVLQLASAAPAETAILAAAQITAANGATNVTSSTDGEGGFYLENLPPGRWALSVVNRKARCNAIITIPEGSPTFVDLGRITCTHE